MITNQTELLDQLERLVTTTGHPSQYLPGYVRAFLQAFEADALVNSERIREVLMPNAPGAEVNINALCQRWEAWTELVRTAVPAGKLQIHDAFPGERGYWSE